MAVKRNIHDALQAYTLRDLQTFRNIIIDLQNNELSIDQLLRYVWYRTLGRNVIPRKVCQSCGEFMLLFEVNNSAGTNIGGKWKSQWFCENCGESILSKKTVVKQTHKVLTANFPFLAANKKAEQEALEWEIARYMQYPITSICPQCKNTMSLYKVTTPVGIRNVHGYKALWFCDHCAYEKYLKHSIKEEAIRLRRI